MICSFSRGFAFIKTRKTASTSIEIALTDFCAPGDIVTPLAAEDELLRWRSGGMPQNFMVARLPERLYRLAIRTGSARWVDLVRRRLHRAQRFRNHMSAAEAAERLPGGCWEPLFRFTVERHPYEKVVSMAAYWVAVRRRYADRTAAEAIEDVIASGAYLNHPLYTINGSLVVSRVLKYEQLTEDLRAVTEQLGLPEIVQLPLAKGGFRTERRPARELLTASQMARIRDRAGFEFDLLAYDP